MHLLLQENAQQLFSSTERNVLCNDALSIFYLRLYGVKHMFNDVLNTFYLWLYGIRHMVKDLSDSERKRAAVTWATLSD